MSLVFPTWRRTIRGPADVVSSPQEFTISTRRRRYRYGCAALCSAGLLTLAACSGNAGTPSPSPSPSSLGATGTPGAPSPTALLSGVVYPLTGLPADVNLANANRPALAVKVDNVQPARPQAGLNDADIVIETPVEGGLTRLFVVFQSRDADLVGPIRSARPVDADLLRLLGHPYFVFSGGTPSDVGPVERNGGAASLLWWDSSPAYFVTRSDHKRPHHVFAHTATLYAESATRGGKKATVPPPLFGFDATAATGTPAQQIGISFPAASAAWTWNGTAYLRTQNGTADTLIGGAQVSATNVVVLSVAIKATAAHDSHGSVVPLPDVLSSGTAWVFRDGVEVMATWKRVKDTIRLVTKDGATVSLRPGNTWVELLPRGRQPKIS